MNRIVALLLVVLAFPLTANGQPMKVGGGSTQGLPLIPLVGPLQPLGQPDTPPFERGKEDHTSGGAIATLYQLSAAGARLSTNRLQSSRLVLEAPIPSFFTARTSAAKQLDAKLLGAVDVYSAARARFAEVA